LLPTPLLILPLLPTPTLLMLTLLPTLLLRPLLRSTMVCILLLGTLLMLPPLPKLLLMPLVSKRRLMLLIMRMLPSNTRIGSNDKNPTEQQLEKVFLRDPFRLIRAERKLVSRRDQTIRPELLRAPTSFYALVRPSAFDYALLVAPGHLPS